jgi:hypothetical protein
MCPRVLLVSLLRFEVLLFTFSLFHFFTFLLFYLDTMSTTFFDCDTGGQLTLRVLAHRTGTITMQRGIFSRPELSKYLQKHVGKGASKVFIQNSEPPRLIWAHHPSDQWMTAEIKDSYDNEDIFLILLRTMDEWRYLRERPMAVSDSSARSAVASPVLSPSRSPLLPAVIIDTSPLSPLRQSPSSPVLPVISNTPPLSPQLSSPLQPAIATSHSSPPLPVPCHSTLTPKQKAAAPFANSLAAKDDVLSSISYAPNSLLPPAIAPDVAPSGFPLPDSKKLKMEHVQSPPIISDGKEPDVTQDRDDVQFETLRDQFICLQKDKASVEAQLSVAQETIAKREKWEEDYKKRKCAEVRREREHAKTALIDAKTKEDAAKAKEDAAKLKEDAVDTLVSTKVEAQVKIERTRADQLSTRADQLSELLQKQRSAQKSTTLSLPLEDAYKSLMAEATKQYTKRLATMSEGVAVPGKGYEYEEFNGWTPMPPHTSVETALGQLFDQTMQKVTYIIGANTYTAALSSSEVGCVQQMNTVTGVTRKVRKAQAATDMTQRHMLLFGPKGPMHLSTSLIQHLVETHNFQGEAQCAVASVELTRLAELYSKIAGTNRTYDSSRTEVFLKPAGLMTWLNAARKEKYEAMRLTLHGSDLAGYAAIKADVLGFSNKYEGKHGLVHGTGFYMGLSEHATKNYNLKSGLPEGTGVMCLVLSSEKEDGSSSFVLAPPTGMDPSLKNAICEKDGKKILILGLVVAHAAP